MKFFSLLIVSVFAFSGFAKTAFVDVQYIIQNSKMGKRIEKKIKSSVKKREKKLKKLENSFKKDKEGLDKEASLISDGERQKRIQALQQKYLKLSEAAAKNQKELQELQLKLTKPLIDKIKQEAKAVAKKRGFDSALGFNDAVLWMNSKNNITSSVFKTFNKKYK